MYTYSEFMSDNFIDNILKPYLLRCKAPRTSVEYVGYIRLLCDELHKDFLEITEDDMELIVNKWKSKGLARRTIRTRLACYSSVAKFILGELEIDFGYINPFEHIVRPEICDDIKPQKIPTLEELDFIMSQAKKEGFMWYLILALVSRACISPSKITQITKDSIFREDGSVGIYFKDKNLVLLPEDVTLLFEEYISTLTLTDMDDHIFFNKHGRPLTIKNLDTKVSDIVKSSGVTEYYTLSNIRSRAILELAKAGVDETVISNYANIGLMRTRQFIEAKGILNGCPANLVNYRLAVGE